MAAPFKLLLKSLNPSMPSGLFYLKSMGVCMVSFLLLPSFVGISELNANSIDPDQTPRYVTSDLGLHCLPVSLLWDARLKWVKRLKRI